LSHTAKKINVGGEFALIRVYSRPPVKTRCVVLCPFLRQIFALSEKKCKQPLDIAVRLN
jgi:hypothetical protein